MRLYKLKLKYLEERLNMLCLIKIIKQALIIILINFILINFNYIDVQASSFKCWKCHEFNYRNDSINCPTCRWDICKNCGSCKYGCSKGKKDGPSYIYLIIFLIVLLIGLIGKLEEWFKKNNSLENSKGESKYIKEQSITEIINRNTQISKPNLISYDNKIPLDPLIEKIFGEEQFIKKCSLQNKDRLEICIDIRKLENQLINEYLLSVMQKCKQYELICSIECNDPVQRDLVKDFTYKFIYNRIYNLTDYTKIILKKYKEIGVSI